MRAKEVLRLLKISRPTLYRYRKEGIITAQKLPSGFYNYHEEDVYRLVNKEIQRKTYLYARLSTRKQKRGLHNQVEQLKQWAFMNGYPISKRHDFTKIFTTNGNLGVK